MSLQVCPNCRVVVRRGDRCVNCSLEFKNGSSTGLSASSGDEGLLFADPRMNLEIRRRSAGYLSIASPGDKVDVLALVKDPDDSSNLQGIQVRTRIRLADNKGWIITGSVKFKQLRNLRRNDNLKSLKVESRLRPSLEKILSESGAGSPRAGGQVSGNSQTGTGVLVGFVDFGMDFMHRNFRHDDGTTRIIALWDQTGAANRKSPFGYGRLYRKNEIDQAIKTSGDDVNTAYNKLGYEPTPDTSYQIGAHGTYVADVAAGNGKGSGCPGLAPEAEIIFVESASCSGAKSIGNSFSGSARLADAVRFIFDEADSQNKPCVVNISLGTNAGAHDGTSLVEMALDSLVKEKPGRAVVIAAGNNGQKGLQASGKVTKCGKVELQWEMKVGDPTLNEMEIWYESEECLEVEIVAPDGYSHGRTPGGKFNFYDEGRGRWIWVANRKKDPLNGKNQIYIQFPPGLPGTWKIVLHGNKAGDVDFNSWIERDEVGQSRFVSGIVGYKVDKGCTLSSIACGELSIVVGMSDGEQSSNGPTVDGRVKPEMISPGATVLAAHSRTLVRRHRISGTSVSAPAVTGVIALMLSKRSGEGSLPTIEELRTALIERGIKQQPGGVRLSVAGALKRI